MGTMMFVPLCLCIYCYTRIIFFTYQCKLELFTAPEDEEEDENCSKIDPLQGKFVPDSSEGGLQPRDPNLFAAVSLMERKLTRLTLVAAFGFMLAWLPFALLCFWEMATPPDEIPTSNDQSNMAFLANIWPLKYCPKASP